jgi:hypothetical protein
MFSADTSPNLDNYRAYWRADYIEISITALCLKEHSLPLLYDLHLNVSFLSQLEKEKSPAVKFILMVPLMR